MIFLAIMNRTHVQHVNGHFIYKVHVNDNMIDFQCDQTRGQKTCLIIIDYPCQISDDLGSSGPHICSFYCHGLVCACVCMCACVLISSRYLFGHMMWFFFSRIVFCYPARTAYEDSNRAQYRISDNNNGMSVLSIGNARWRVGRCQCVIYIYIYIRHQGVTNRFRMDVEKPTRRSVTVNRAMLNRNCSLIQSPLCICCKPAHGNISKVQTISRMRERSRPGRCTMRAYIYNVYYWFVESSRWQRRTHYSTVFFLIRA